MTEEPITTTEATKAEAARKARRTGRLNHATTSVTVTEGKGGAPREYDFSAMSSTVMHHLALVGAWNLFRMADDMDALHAELTAGRLPEASAAPSVWRQAIAAAFVEATKKAASPLTREQADARVTNLTPTEFRQAKNDPAVIKHYMKLTGGKSPLMSLLDKPGE